MKKNEENSTVTLQEEIYQLEQLLLQKREALQLIKKESTIEGNVKKRPQNQEQNFHDTLKQTSVLVVSFDTQGKIIFCNNRFTSLMQYAHEELAGVNIFSFFNLKDTSTAKKITIDKLEESFEGELTVKSGEIVFVRLNTIIFKAADNQISGYTFIGEDITEQVLLTQALYETNALLQDIFDSSHDIIFIFDEKGNILFVNKTFKKVLGFSSEELELHSIFDFVAPDLKRKTRQILEQADSKGELQNFETAFINQSGKRVQLTGTLSSKKEEEGKRIYRATFFDITEQQKVKKSQELYFGIAKLIEKGIPITDFYYNFYLHLQEAIGVDSFLIILKKDEESINVPFYVNSNFGSDEPVHGLSFAEDALILNRPMFMYEETIKKIYKQRNIEPASKLPRVWLGVPLVLGQMKQGLVVVQSYVDRKAHDKRDLELLTFISGQLTSAIIRANNEEQINNQSARLEAIFESGSHLMWTIERNGNLNRYNQNFFKKTEDYLKIRPYYRMSLLSELRGSLKNEIHSWVPRYVNAFKGITQQFEVKYISHTGEENWWDVALNPIKDGRGKTIEVSGVAHDITQKKITEIGLAESEEKFRNIFDSLLDVYFRVNMNGIITMVSPSVFELMGRSQLEIVGKHISDFYLNRSKLTFLIKRLLKDGYVKNFESRIIEEADNNPHNIISNFRLLYDTEGNPSHIEGVARDITELKNKTEELRAAKNLAEKSLEVKKRFLSNMSHEIRTPMNGIIGMIDLISSSRLNDEQLEYVSIIKKSSGTLLNILNDILDLSKIEAGKMELRLQPTSLNNVLDKLLALFKQNADSKNTQLNLILDESVPAGVMADETRLLQILSNLTSNAIKFTENGAVTIRCKLLSKEHRISNVLFEVEDTGIGIAENDLRDLFKQFSQVDTSYTKSYGGTGLGLAISKELCKMMNGEIGVRSELNQGSTFWFTAHLTECDQELVEKRYRIQVEDDTQFAIPPKILIVDDNEVNRVVASTILRKVGCKVEIVESAKKALSLLSNFRFDLIFMDIQMPEMNGIMATQKIHEMGLPNTPPIIAMTAFSMKEEREEFLSAGMDDYVAKPIKANVLIGKVKKWYKETENKLPPNANIAKENEHSAELPIIDMKIPEELEIYGGKDLIEVTYKEFETNGIRLVEQVENNFSENNIEGVINALHTLKGDAGTLGLQKIYMYTKKIEQDFKNGHKLENANDVKLLHKMFREFQDNYKEILNL